MQIVPFVLRATDGCPYNVDVYYFVGRAWKPAPTTNVVIFDWSVGIS